MNGLPIRSSTDVDVAMYDVAVSPHTTKQMNKRTHPDDQPIRMLQLAEHLPASPSDSRRDDSRRAVLSVRCMSWCGRHRARFRNYSRPVSPCCSPEPDMRIVPRPGAPRNHMARPTTTFTAITPHEPLRGRVR
ncbi:conserved hypothetical protein (plasmid) [Rhodococcus jostii RHA1]|uniref:Uncharacterized protein n=1 Tax=Rhodococcus jostii (strain RHA1) TaxID=101510 RepID=Q0RX88_RHOJR|nr:conserved hypothetical protein [Rhodococcus jostii RHA1]